MDFFGHFEEFGTLGRRCNSFCISLAPKVKDPSTLSDYMPIILIGCVYRIISKLLDTRIKTVVGKIVGGGSIGICCRAKYTRWSIDS